MMNPEVKAIWIEALRSERYQQGYGRLHDEEGKFCALGVLCDTQGVKWGESVKGVGPTYTHGGQECIGAPSRAHQIEWGLATGSETGIADTIRLTATLNDIERITFNQIADWIEETL